MRIALIIVFALGLAPIALTAISAVPRLTAAPATELSAAKKKPKPKKAKEEYLKAAPGTGPSGPKN